MFRGKQYLTEYNLLSAMIGYDTLIHSISVLFSAIHIDAHVGYIEDQRRLIGL